MITTLSNIPFELNAEALLSQAHIQTGSEDAETFLSLIDLAREHAAPKAVYAEGFIDARNGDTVTINGVAFTSTALTRNLADIERVFPFVATCGTEADAALPRDGDFLKEYWWDLIKNALLVCARATMMEQLRKRYRLVKTSAMFPGSGDTNVWPIQQQSLLFALLEDVEDHIGVTLTDSFLMVPGKSVSGIIFPTEKGYESCQVCHRATCPSRSAPFDSGVWNALMHDEVSDNECS